VTSVGGTAYAYDNNGNVTAIGSLDYTWDYKNRLASAKRSGGNITSYGYDHTGQRVFKATGSATTTYPNRNYNVASTTGAATTTKHIFSPDGTLLAVVVGSGTTTTSTTYLHPDHLGGTNVATDESGTVVQTLDYYPYGSQRIATGSFDEQRRYIGEEFDQDSKFSYLNARYYEGSRGQFLSQDPVLLAIGSGGEDGRSRQQLDAFLTDPQSLNGYSYARNNPIRFSDPQGLWYREFITGQQSWPSFQLELGEAANYLGQNNSTWNFAFEHPVATGMVIVGPLSGVAAASGLQAYAAFHAATYPGVGAAYAAKQMLAGLVYSLLTGSTLGSIPANLATLGHGGPASYYSTLWSLALNSSSLAPGYIGAISDIGQFGALTAQGVINVISNLNSSNVQARVEAVNSFNSATGASSNESKLWATPNGTVITWTGQIVSSAPGSN
jgi:RHS repeat-associated protein